MASAPIIECPLTPELIDQCPVTPEAHSDENDARPQSPLNSAPSSDGSSERQGAGSPPPNCAICLGRCVNKCFTDNCMHKFCFSCLMEWSKIKAECPLCKKPFRSIIHNVKSLNQFDEYIVNQPTRPRPQPRLHRLNVILSDRPRFRYRTTFQVNPNESEAIQQLFLHQSHSQDLRSEQSFLDHLIAPRNHNNRTRRQVYESRMYAQPLFDINGRDRLCSALFYRENPAQVHRLMPWITREILALTNNVSFRADFLISIIHEMLTQHDITSPQFFEAVEPHLLDRTSHFIHELHTFARSPYDIYGFDRYVRYSAPVEESVVISTEDSSDGEDNVSFMTRRGRTEFTIETRSNVSTVILTGSFRCPPTSSGAANNNVGVIDISNDGSSVANAAGSSSTSNTETINIVDDASGSATVDRPVSYIESLTDSDSDECMFVREQKPPHLRTPEYIELNSADEDSDVVFVDNNVDNNSHLPPKKRTRVETIPAPNETVVSDTGAGTSSIMKTESEAGPSLLAATKVETVVSNSEPLPSTSSTVISASATNDTVKARRKYYAEPSRRQNRMQKHSNRIFDASSSSSSSSSHSMYSCSESSSPVVAANVKALEYYKSPLASPTPSNSSSTTSSSHEEYKVYTSARRKKRSSTKRKSISTLTRTKRRKITSSKTTPPAHRKKDKSKYPKTIKLKSLILKKYETSNQEQETNGIININRIDVTSASAHEENSNTSPVKTEGTTDNLSTSLNSSGPDNVSISIDPPQITNNDVNSDSSMASSSSTKSPRPGSSKSPNKRNHHNYTNVYISSHFNKSSTSTTSSSSTSSTSSSSEDSDF